MGPEPEKCEVPESPTASAGRGISALLAASLPHLKARLETLKATYPAEPILKQREELQLLVDRINMTIGR